ncbi:hypothetical protein ACGFYV_25785 [Streptomyces sp. NPDC048297]|uniref:hypothetical protein n=1 Tax=Streptomyces sp. NPDC048297 TaxID=3365531 RepID=UPI0037185337
MTSKNPRRGGSKGQQHRATPDETGGIFAAVIEGQAALRCEVRDGFSKVSDRFDALEEKMDRNQAQTVELLTVLVGKNPNPS